MMASDTTISEHTLVALLPALQACVESQDRECFRHRVETIDWSTHTPEEMLAVVQMALDIEMTQLAKKIVRHARQLFPNHEKVQYWTRILSPVDMKCTYHPRGKGIHESANWINEHAYAYRGQWIAVREGKLLGAAHSLKELDAIVGYEGSPDNILFTQVLVDE